MKYRYVIGIDEAGRGPLAGPVAVGAVLLPWKSQRFFKGVRDSKKISAEKREQWFLKLKGSEGVGCRYKVVMNSAKVIDQKGIVFAIRNALTRAIRHFKVNPNKCLVLLDGGLRAPPEFIYQKTIIRGDDKEVSISLAAIAAKVTRDHFMKKVAKKFPGYGLEIHKGYGTVKHFKSLRKLGPSIIHRESFLSSLRG